MSVWISKLLGPLILALGLRMVFGPASLQETTRRFLADRPLVLISGILAMTAGLAIVNTHNVWVLEWTLLVTLFGWALVVGGAVRILAPGVVNTVGGEMMQRAGLTRAIGALWALLGGYLSFKGYS